MNGEINEQKATLQLLDDLDAEADREFSLLPERLTLLPIDDQFATCIALKEHWERLRKNSLAIIEQSTRGATATEIAPRDLIAAQKKTSTYIGGIHEDIERQIHYHAAFPKITLERTILMLAINCAIGCLVILTVSFFVISPLARKLRLMKVELAEVSRQLTETESGLDKNNRDKSKIRDALDEIAATLDTVMKGEGGVKPRNFQIDKRPS